MAYRVGVQPFRVHFEYPMQLLANYIPAVFVLWFLLLKLHKLRVSLSNQRSRGSIPVKGCALANFDCAVVPFVLW